MALKKEENVETMEVLAGCPAPLHNTLRAATRGIKEQRCVCPSALLLAKQENQRTARIRKARREERVRRGTAFLISPLPGGGPWRIADECPALIHNTQRAACSGPAKTRCVCPHGLDLRHRRNSGIAAWKQAHKQPQPKIRSTSTQGGRHGKESAYLTNVRRPANAPSMVGNCRTERGRKLADRLLGAARGAVEEHRTMCTLCPALAACRRWVLEEEQPAGSWGGMYGALTVAERKRIASKREGTA